jgi:hypothetical protein
MSNSVHRIRSSFEAFAERLRPMLNKPSVPSSISPGPAGLWFWYSDALFRFKSNSRRRNGRLLVDARRENVTCVGIGAGKSIGLAALDRPFVAPSFLAWYGVEGRAQLESLEVRSVEKALSRPRRFGRAHAGAAENPDCVCKKCSNDAEGADSFGDSMSECRAVNSRDEIKCAFFPRSGQG